MNTGVQLKSRFPDTCEHLLQCLQSMAKIGSPRQAKHAVRCIANMFDNKEELFDQIAEVSVSARAGRLTPVHVCLCAHALCELIWMLRAS